MMNQFVCNLLGVKPVSHAVSG